LLIIFIGTFSAFVAVTIWLFSKALWDKTDSHDPRKLFAREVFSDLREHLPQLEKKGSTSAGLGEDLIATRKRQDADEIEK